jgi:NADPH:quinone reductase-like Zn-dependent oxidoreductase
MRALEVHGPGRFEIVERPDPSPGPGEVVVRIGASTLNFRDLAMIRTARGAAEPFVPLSDGAGVVEAVGAGVTRWRTGDRATTLFYGSHWEAGQPEPSVNRLALGQPSVDGCAQELLVIDQHGIVPTPDAMSDEEAAALTCAGVTAWRALTVHAAVRAGDVGLFEGTGGVSVFGLQISHAMGLETIITSSSDKKLSRARSLGADHVINYRSEPEWGTSARRMIGGRGVDVVLEVGGANTLEQAMNCLAFDGDVCCIGAVAGTDWSRPRLDFSLFDLVPTSRHVHGSMVGSRQDHEALMALCALHRISPVIDMSFSWTELEAALAAQASGAHFGKVALTLN